MAERYLLVEPESIGRNIRWRWRVKNPAFNGLPNSETLYVDENGRVHGVPKGKGDSFPRRKYKNIVITLNPESEIDSLVKGAMKELGIENFKYRWEEL